MSQFKLTNVEESLIAKHCVVMSAYRLKGGSAGFKGNVISFPQDIADVCKMLPRLPQNCGIFKARSFHSNQADKYIDFKVRRGYVLQWLQFLKKWSFVYRDIEISSDNLNKLPIDGSIYNDLPFMTEEDLDDVMETDDVEDFTDDDDDYGFEMGPNGDDGEPHGDHVFDTSIGVQEEERNEIDIIKESILIWPKRSELPVDERNANFLLASAFPTLFPCSAGDVTFKGRRQDVSMKDAIEHYMKYFDVKLNRYPFAEHPRFLHYVQNIDERQRINSQASVYINQNAVDRDMSKEDLMKILKSKNAEKFAIESRMGRYGAKILGSPQYFVLRKKELLALIDQKGSPHIWFTLSLPNEYWEGLQKILQVSKTTTAKEMFIRNPHIADAYFRRQAELFFKIFFGNNGIESSWCWFRYEFQKRGNIHLHGMMRLNIEEEFPALGEIVIRGRKSHRLLSLIKEKSPIDDLMITEKLSTIVPTAYTEDKLDDNTLVSQIPIDLTIDFIDSHIQNHVAGIIAEKKIVGFRDFLLTTMNTCSPLPTDAAASNRDEPSTEKRERHPSNKLHETMNATDYCLNCYETNSLYKDLVTAVQRHRHNHGYCMREGKCRFGFPRKIAPYSRLVVRDIYGERGTNKGKVIRTKVDFEFATNDGWLNSHAKFALLAWSANLDMSVLIDRESVVRYIAKYCLKVERPTQAFENILKDSMKLQQEQGDEIIMKKVIRRTFNRMTGCRDKSVMEISHLILSAPYVECSHTFVNINLFNGARFIEEDDVGVYKENLLDLYAKRMQKDSWRETTNCNEEILRDMNLNSFLTLFQTYKQKNKKVKIVPRRLASKPVVPVFSPDVGYFCHPTHSQYWKYCLVMLIKEKPWVGHMATVFGSDNESLLNVDEVSDVQKNAIVDAFVTHFRNPTLKSYNTDQPLQREIKKLLDQELTLSAEDAYLSFATMETIDEKGSSNMDEFKDLDIDEEKIEWDREYDFKQHNHEYDEELHIDAVKQKHKANRNGDEKEESRRVLHLSDISGTDKGSLQQRQVVETFLDICGLMTDENGRFKEPHRSKKDPMSHVLLVPGPAGTGKSFVIDVLYTELKERWLIYNRTLMPEDPFDPIVLVCAPTGKAALAIGGYTIQSSDGLKVPTENLNNPASNILNGSSLLAFQARLRKTIAIILDEYSMISSVQLFWINRRLQAAMGNNLHFGGIPIIIFGDPGQIAPVGGCSLWLSKSILNKHLNAVAMTGHDLYRKITNVLYLTEVRRQSGQYRDVLLRLRDGNNDENDWEFLKRYCYPLMSSNRQAAFLENDCLHIRASNEECNRVNRKRLQDLKRSIVLLEAKHSNCKPNTYSDENFRRLKAKLYISVGARIMLTMNVCVNVGLVNGSMGDIVDIIYKTSQPPDLPEFIIVNFPSYSGLPFFIGEDRKHWVPLLPSTVNYSNKAGKTVSRIQYPIQLAYALTAHKAQGLTSTSKTVVELPQKETHVGITYVQLSRCTDIENLCILNAVSLERITTGISNNKSLKLRLLEENRLGRLWKETKTRFSLSLYETYPNHQVSFARIDSTKESKAEKKIEAAQTETDNTSSNQQAKPPHSKKRVVSNPKAKGRNSMPSSNPGTLHIRHLTDAEKTEFRERLHEPGNGAEVLVSFDNLDPDVPHRIDRRSFQLLHPTEWLNDEIINGFMALLRVRDAELNPCNRSHFASTFFSKLYVAGGCMYNNVRNWHRFVPGGNIFSLEKFVVPIDIGNGHWTCAVIHMNAKKVAYYDSLKGRGKKYMKALFNYVKEEWRRRHNTELPCSDEWSMTTVACPHQRNGYDCGVFVCFYARCLCMGLPMSFTQGDIADYGRQYTGMSILRGILL